MHRISDDHQQQAASSSCYLAAAVDGVPANGHQTPDKAVTASVYRAKISSNSRVAIVYCSRDLLFHAFAVAIAGVDDTAAECKIELCPR